MITFAAIHAKNQYNTFLRSSYFYGYTLAIVCKDKRLSNPLWLLRKRCNDSWRNMEAIAFPILFIYLIFITQMPRINENASRVNNSSTAGTSNSTKTVSSTPGHESVEILFGLTPKQVCCFMGYFLDKPRLCNKALDDMFKAIKVENKKGKNTDNFIKCIESVRVLACIERMEYMYENIRVHFWTVDSNNWLSEADKWIMKIIESVHKELIYIVKKIDEIGIADFASNAIEAISYTKTKEEYRDICLALAIAQTIYIHYTRNRVVAQSEKCVAFKSKKSTT